VKDAVREREVGLRNEIKKGEGGEEKRVWW